MTNRLTVIAIDWSGRKNGAENRIWLAKSNAEGKLEELCNGRDRFEMETHLVHEASLNKKLVVGLDFAFSLPAWFLEKRKLSGAKRLWEQVERDGETWLKDCKPPFWGRKGCPKPELPDHYRCTERAVPRIGGIAPKSVFQIGGAGAVGTGSLRGMPHLLHLNRAGFSVWPFDKLCLPVVVEIYPRVFTPNVNKSSTQGRSEFLENNYPRLDDEHRDRAVENEDAFDAAVSALAMFQHIKVFRRLSQATERQIRQEGQIWQP